MIGLSIRLMSRGASVNAPSAKTGLFALGPSLQAAGEAEDIAGPGWANPSDQTLASVVALPRTRGVTPAVLTAGAASATYQRRQNVLGGETGQILISAIVRAGASDGVAIYAGGDSLTTVARTRITAGLVSGAVTFGAFDGLATFETRATMSVIALERLAPPYARVWAIMQTAAGQANGMICVGPGENGGAVTVDRCDAYRLTLPAFSFAAPRSDASGTEMTLSADWAGWALGGSVEYRVDGGSAIAVPAPGTIVVPTAKMGSLIELRAVYPLPVAGVGVTAIAVNTGVTRIETPWTTGLVAALYVPSNGARNVENFTNSPLKFTTFNGATLVDAEDNNGFAPAGGGFVGLNSNGTWVGGLTIGPCNDFNDLDPSEARVVSIPYRLDGDVSDRTLNITFTGPVGLGRDLVRGVTPSGGVYTLLEPVPEGHLVNIAYQISGTGSATVSMSGVSGRTETAAGWHSDTLRAGPGGASSITVTLTGAASLTAIHVRRDFTEGAAAPIQYLRANKPTATTLNFDFGCDLAQALPAFSTAGTASTRHRLDVVGTPEAPTVTTNSDVGRVDQGAWSFVRRTVSNADRLPAYPFTTRVEAGGTVEVEFTVSGAGSVTPVCNGVAGTARTTNGTFTDSWVVTRTAREVSFILSGGASVSAVKAPTLLSSAITVSGNTGILFSARAAYRAKHAVFRDYGGLLMSIGYRLCLLEDVALESTIPAGITEHSLSFRSGIGVGTFGAGQTLTGSTSGATATIVTGSSSTTAGDLRISVPSTRFLDGETITSSGGKVATADRNSSVISQTNKGLNVWRGGSEGANRLRLTDQSLFIANGLRLHTQASTSYYDELVAGGWYSQGDVQSQEGIGIDYGGPRFDADGKITIYNYFCRWSPDAALDPKSPTYLQFGSIGEGMSWSYRSWYAANIYCNIRWENKPIDVAVPGSIRVLTGRFAHLATVMSYLAYWRVADETGDMFSAPPTASGMLQIGISGQGNSGTNVSTKSVQVLHMRPRRPEYTINATDFDVEVSSDGGASWSPLNVGMGPNDAIGSLYRRGVPVAASVNRLRVRSRWGAAASDWRTVTV